MQAGDEDECHDDRDRVGVDEGIWNASDHPFDQAGKERFADPSESKASNSYSELDAVDDLIQVLVKLEDGAGPDAMSFNELKNARLAHAHQSEFGCREKGISCDQKYDEHHSQQYISNHGIWTFYIEKGFCQRFYRQVRRVFINLATDCEDEPQRQVGKSGLAAKLFLEKSLAFFFILFRSKS